MRTKIALAILALSLPTLALLVVDSQISYVRQTESALEAQTTSAGFLASLVDFSFDEGIALARSYAFEPDVQSLDAARIHPFLAAQATLFPQYHDLAVVDARGQALVSARLPRGQPLPNIADREYFRRAMADNKPVVSNLLISRVTETPVIAFTAPIAGPDGQPVGVVITALAPSFLAQRIAAVPLPAQQDVFLVDRAGRVSFHLAPRGDGLVGMDVANYSPVAVALQGSPFRGIVSPTLLGDERAVAAVPTPEYGWVVGVSTPTSILRAAILGPTLIRLAILLATVAAVSLIAFALAQRLLSAPLSSLGQRLLAVARGDLTQRVDIKTGDELETLGHAFNQWPTKYAGVRKDWRRAKKGIATWPKPRRTSFL